MSGMRPQENQVATGAAAITTTAATTLIAAPDFGRIDLFSLQLARTDSGTAALQVTVSDLKSTVLVLDNPGTGRSIPFVFEAPLQFAVKAAVTLQASVGVTTLFASGQGYIRE
jgi:hypothetical protein